MKVWFVRSNGHTAHNNPATSDYVPGEPPVFPRTDFNYRQKCLSDGFARSGWPNTGDLRQPGVNRLAVNGYTLASIEDRCRRYLHNFLSILTGDLILIPADVYRYDVHLGIVVHRDPVTRKIVNRGFGKDAYYYYHDIPNGEWYECAHRVDVLWDQASDGSFRVHHIEAIP
ncbi:MAG: hypothetical protein JW963_18040, partial [Anaerolineales bacterium]|nr:hypothetical protein [Anaerolineales bacterium]